MKQYVAADVSPLIISLDEFQPAHVGCYGIPNSAGATGRALRNPNSALERLFS